MAGVKNYPRHGMIPFGVSRADEVLEAVQQQQQQQRFVGLHFTAHASWQRSGFVVCADRPVGIGF